MVDGVRRFDWAAVEESHSLADGKLPIPTVTWTAPGFRLDTTLLADHAGRASYATYTLTNRLKVRRSFELRLGVRPWQVNPPAQFLAQQGGASPIAMIGHRGNDLLIVQPQDEGDEPVTRRLRFTPGADVVPATLPRRRGDDMLATDLVYRLNLKPRETAASSSSSPRESAIPPASRRAADTTAHWRYVLGRVKLRVPPSKQAVADTLATAFSQILDQPGRADAQARHAQLRPRLDPRRRDDGRSIAAHGPRRRRPRFCRLVPAQLVQERQSPMLRRFSRRRPGARERQPRRIYLPGRRALPFHRRPRRARTRLAVGARRDTLHGPASVARAHAANLTPIGECFTG